MILEKLIAEAANARTSMLIELALIVARDNPAYSRRINNLLERMESADAAIAAAALEQP